MLASFSPDSDVFSCNLCVPSVSRCLKGALAAQHVLTYHTKSASFGKWRENPARWGSGSDVTLAFRAGTGPLVSWVQVWPWAQAHSWVCIVFLDFVVWNKNNTMNWLLDTRPAVLCEFWNKKCAAGRTEMLHLQQPGPLWWAQQSGSKQPADVLCAGGHFPQLTLFILPALTCWSGSFSGGLWE